MSRRRVARSVPAGTRRRRSGGAYNDEGRYEGGSWIDIHYGRPILRGRQGIFGAGEEFGQRIYAGAPVWRVGADQTTTFTTEVDLLIGGQRLNAGEYTMFADLADPTAWTLIFSTWGVKQTFTEDNPNALWGAYGYDDSKDVMRTTMSVETVDYSMGSVADRFRRHDLPRRRDVLPLGQPVGERSRRAGELAVRAARRTPAQTTSTSSPRGGKRR